MISVKMQGYKVDYINFISTLENGTKIKLGQKYQYNVQYSKDNSMCRGQFEIEVFDTEHQDKFNIKAVVVGFFHFDCDERRETIHADSFKALFPYVKALITTITANCGIKPIIIPEIDIDNQEIYRFDGNSQ